MLITVILQLFKKIALAFFFKIKCFFSGVGRLIPSQAEMKSSIFSGVVQGPETGLSTSTLSTMVMGVPSNFPMPMFMSFIEKGGSLISPHTVSPALIHPQPNSPTRLFLKEKWTLGRFPGV